MSVCRVAKIFVLAVIGICLAAFPGWGYVDSRHDTTAAVIAGAEALDAWDLNAAESFFADLRASKESSSSPGIITFLAAKLDFYNGKYGPAAESAERFPESLINRSDVASLQTIIRDTAVIIPGLETVTSDHFTVHFDPRDRVLSLYALDALEAAYRRAGEIFSLYPDRKIRVEILPDAESFRRVSSLTRRDIEVSGAVGICKFNKLMILSPRVMLRGYRWLDTLCHEYIHYLVVRISRNRCPIWLHEGLAVTYQNRWRTEEDSFPTPLDESLLAGAISEDRLYSLEEMDPSLIRLPSAREVSLGFAEVASLIRYLDKTYGQRVFEDLLAAYRDGADLKKAVTVATGVAYDEVVADWKRFLDGMNFREIPGILPPVYLLAEENKDVLSEQEIATAVARQRARLGLRLEAQNRPLAAYLEYRRALKDEPLSPFLLARGALSAIKAGRQSVAGELVEKGEIYYPGYPALHLARGKLALMEKDLKTAAASFSEAVAVNPFDPEPHRYLVEISAGLGKTAVAERERKALQYLGYPIP